MKMLAEKSKKVRGLGGGWNRQSQEEHLRNGTYRRDRHGPIVPSILAYPKPPLEVRESIAANRRWIRNQADELAFAKECRFNEGLAEHAAGFFPKFLRHSKGQWAGKPFDLLPWQRDDLIYPLFGWLRPDGTRRFRRVFIEIPKKNGKSTLASGLGLYMLCADGEGGAEIYSTASDQDQASIVHREAIAMVDASPELSAVLKVNRSTHNILLRATDSYYRALAANPRTMEGRHIHCCIIDELHIWPGRAAWDSLRWGFRSRTQPIQFVITTAGDDDQSVCYQQLEHGRGVVAGTIQDDTLLPLIYEASPEDDWLDENVWAKANPSLGTTFTLETLREDVTSIKGRPAEEASWKRYTLNIWQKSANPWLSPEAWERNRREFTEADLLGCECYAGLDLSRTRDMTALVLVFPWDEDGKKVYRQLARFWLPQAGVETYKGKIDVPGWMRSGWLEIMADSYAQVEAAIVEAQEKFDLREVAFDRMYARDLIEKLQQDHGIEPVEFPQTIMQLAGPTAEYERLLMLESLHHNGNPVLTWQAGHVQVKSDANANKRPIKPPNEDHRKIDGIVAGIMALGRAMQNQEVSAYETHGVLTVADIMAEGAETIEEVIEDGTYA